MSDRGSLLAFDHDFIRAFFSIQWDLSIRSSSIGISQVGTMDLGIYNVTYTNCIIGVTYLAE